MRCRRSAVPNSIASLLRAAWRIRTGAAVALLVLLAAGQVRGASARVLVIYSGGNKTAYTAQWVVPALTNLLGHFDCTATVIPADAYQAGQVEAHDAVIYLGFGAEGALPEALLADMYDSDRTVCWLGSGINQLGDRFSLGRYGFRVDPGVGPDKYPRVLYRAQVLKRPRAPMTRISVTDRVSCHVLANAQAGANSLPYVVRAGSFWYFADIPLLELSETGSQLVLADQLHDILDQRHPARRTALIVIAGVSAETDPGAVRGLTRYLQSEKLPYSISVIPVFKDSEHHSEIPLSQRRAIVGVVRGAQRAGAGIISSGLTHQYQGRSGEDAEFWDTRRNRPPLGRTPSETGQRIKTAIAELSRCGLYPIVWSTPMGRASSSDYTEIAGSCETAWERRLTSVLAPAPQTFPFFIDRDSFGQKVIPDNLAPLRGGSGEVETILEQARCQTVVPDPWLTVVLTPQAPLDAVKLLLSSIKGMSFEFADLRRSKECMKGQSIEIHCSDETVEIAKLIPDSWDATVLGPGRRDLKRFESAGVDGREQAQLPPGALLIAYARGARPREIFAFEGGPEELAQRAVAGIARTVVTLAVAACVLFILIYVVQISLLRRT
jgi:hypothetical protein